MGLPDGSAGKESTCNERDTGDLGSFPGSGRYPKGENGNPVQYSCLKNSMDRGAWWATVRAAAKVRHNLSKKQHLHLTITTTNKKEATNLRKHLAKKCTK